MKFQVLVTSILLFGILVSGALAAQDYGLPSCWTPSHLEGTDYYEYADGLNNTDHFDGSYSVNASAALLNATILTRLGATGMTQKYAMHFENYTAGGVRGLAYLFINGSYYYAVFQYENAVWGIPNLQLDHNESAYWYDNGVEGVFFFENTTINVTAVKLSKAQIRASGGQQWIYFDLYRFGNASAFNASSDWSGGPATNTLVPCCGATYEGNVTTIGHNTGTASGVCHYSQIMTMGNDTGDTTFDLYAGYHLFNIPSSGTCTRDTSPDVDNYTHWYEIDYWGCELQLGNITFTAFEGSDECTSGGYIPAITCSISGESVTIPASGTTTTLNYTGYPSFSSIEEITSTCDVVNQAPETAYIAPNDNILFIPMSKANNPALWFYMKHYVISGNPYEEACTNSRHSQLQAMPGEPDVLKFAFVAGYSPPNGNVNNIGLNTITFNTSLITNALKTQCQVCVFGQCVSCNAGDPGCSCPSYNVTFVAGYNSTHYRRTYVNVSAGAKTVTVTNSSSLSALLNTEQLYYADLLGFDNYFSFNTAPGGWDYYGNKSIWLHPTENYIGRFMLYWVVFDPGTAPIYEGDIVTADDSGFNMSFNWSQFNISFDEVTGFPYDTYTYTCAIPTGYYDYSNTSTGLVTVDEPVENIKVILQRQRALWLELYLKNGNAPVPNAVCYSGAGSPPVLVSSSTGLCNITNLKPDDDFNVTVTTPTGAKATAEIVINDYYNTEGCGETPACINFTGAYRLTWDISKPLASVTVYVGDNSNAGVGIQDASVYWNGILKGVTLGDGKTMFNVLWVFCEEQNLTAMKYGFYNETEWVKLVDNAVYRLSLTPLSAQASKENAALSMLGDQASVMNFIANKQFIGIIMVIVVSAIGAGYAGIPGLLAGMGGSSFLLMVMGLFPLTWFAIIFAMVALLGAGSLKDVLAGVTGRK